MAPSFSHLVVERTFWMLSAGAVISGTAGTRVIAKKACWASEEGKPMEVIFLSVGRLTDAN